MQLLENPENKRQVRRVIAEFNKDSLAYEELEKNIALNEKLKAEIAKRKAAEKEKEVAEQKRKEEEEKVMAAEKEIEATQRKNKEILHKLEIAQEENNALQAKCKMQKRETDALQAALDNNQKEQKKPDWSLKDGSSYGEWEKKSEEPAVGDNQTKTETEPATSDNDTVVWKTVAKCFLFVLQCIFVFTSFHIIYISYQIWDLQAKLEFLGPKFGILIVK